MEVIKLLPTLFKPDLKIKTKTWTWRAWIEDNIVWTEWGTVGGKQQQNSREYEKTYAEAIKKWISKVDEGYL